MAEKECQLILLALLALLFASLVTRGIGDNEEKEFSYCSAILLALLDCLPDYKSCKSIDLALLSLTGIACLTFLHGVLFLLAWS